MTKTLPALRGTEYTVEVTRDSERFYVVRAYRPLRDGERMVWSMSTGHQGTTDKEEVGARTLSPTASHKELNRVVEDIISRDNPSIVGVYTAEQEEDTE